MDGSIWLKLWNISPRSIAERLSLNYFTKRIVFNGVIPLGIEKDEVDRLLALPRYVSAETQILGKKLQIVDGCSFVGMCEEIFVKKNYEFEAGTKNPLIIDCGANVGLSVVFFKMLYPHAKIIAFEADPYVYQVLEKNVASFGFSDVELHNTAVWSEETVMSFHVEGSWGGRVCDPEEVIKKIDVRTVKLSDFLDQKVDFLKIDVEGAETEVIKDCAGKLRNVNHLFVEYHSFANKGQSLHEILAALHSCGFRYHIKEAVHRRDPFLKSESTGMDSQLDVFAVRCR